MKIEKGSKAKKLLNIFSFILICIVVQSFALYLNFKKNDSNVAENQALFNGKSLTRMKNFKSSTTINLPKEMWSFDYNHYSGRSPRAFYCAGIATPVFDDKNIYIGIDSSVGNEGSVIALDKNTGKQQWEFVTVGDVKLPPALKDNILYFGTSEHLCNNSFYAINAKTGEKKWVFTSKVNDFELASLPIISKDKIFYNASSPGGGDCLFALDQKNGKEIWSFKYEGNGMFEAPVVFNDVLYFGFYNTDFEGRDSVFALSVETGKLLWKFEIEDNSVFSGPFEDDNYIDFPLIYDNKISFSHSGQENIKIYVLSVNKGELIWDFKVNTNLNENIYNLHFLLFKKNNIYFCDNENSIYCINTAKGGEEIWRFSSDDPFTELPIVANEMFYFATSTGDIYAIDINSGNIAWRNKNKPLGNPSERFNLSHLVSSKNALLVHGDVNGVQGPGPFLLAFDCMNGNQMWRYNSLSIFKGPFISEEVIFFSGHKGDLCAIY